MNFSQRQSIRVVGWLAGLLFATTALTAEVTHLGGHTMPDPGLLRIYDVRDPGSPELIDESELFGSDPVSRAIVHDSTYWAVGSEVHRCAESDRAGSCTTWSSGSSILEIADGPLRGQVLVLDANGLSLVQFSDAAAPVVLWTHPIDASNIGSDFARLLLRDGNLVYVSDPSLPGVTVLSIDPSGPPTVAAGYVSPEGVVHDLALWGRALMVATDRTVVLLSTGDTDVPELTRIGARTLEHRPACSELTSEYAFVADGADLVVLDVDPTSPNFLLDPVDFWVSPSPIRQVTLDRRGRAYVVLDDSWEVLDVARYTR